jgi:exosortase
MQTVTTNLILFRGLTTRKVLTLGGVVLLASFGLLYRDVMVKLINDWYTDENYSHGFLVVPVALYFAWERRSQFLSAAWQPSFLGLVIVSLSIGLLLGGILGAEVFTTQISMLGTVVGTVLFLYGPAPLRIMAFPIMFLLLMIPIPAIIFNQITFPLQLMASRFAENTLSILQIPVLREGNLIHLPNITLEVVEACSGIRSLVSLLTLGIVYAYFMEPRVWARIVLAVSTVPIAIFANGLRVAGTGVAARYVGPAAAEGFFHTFSGWLVFVNAVILLFLVHRVTRLFLTNIKPTAGVALEPASGNRT